MIASTTGALDDRMRGAVREALDCFHEGPAFEVLAADQDKFKTVYPLSAHVMELVEAADLLVDKGLPYAAEPCARAALQYAVTAQWIVLTHAGEYQVPAELKRNHRATVHDFSMSVALPDDLLAHAGLPSPSQGPARDFWRMCERFSKDKSLYFLFRRLSDAVHPSLRTLSLHLDADDERGVFGLTQPWPERRVRARSRSGMDDPDRR